MAMACQVCGEWLGSGVSRDIADLKRVQQLLVSSLNKLPELESSPSIYGDAVATLESLAVLKAWAELYIKLSHENFSETNELIASHLPMLSKYWILALQDYAYLSLPAKFNTQLPSSGGTFFNALITEFVKPYYDSNWSSLLHAAAISIGRQSVVAATSADSQHEHVKAPPTFAGTVPINIGVPLPPPTDERHNAFHILMGIAVQALCNSDTYDSPHDILCCLNAIDELVMSPISSKVFLNDEQLIVELLDLLHRVCLTSNTPSTMQVTLNIAKNIASRIGVAEANPNVSKSLLVVAVYCPFLYVPGLSKPSSVTTTVSSTSSATSVVASDVKDQLICSSMTLFPSVVQLHPQPNELFPLLFYFLLKSLSHIKESSFSSISHSFKLLCSLVTEESSNILQSLLASLLEDDNIQCHAKLLMTSLLLLTKTCQQPHPSLFEKWCAFSVACLTDTRNPKV